VSVGGADDGRGELTSDAARHRVARRGVRVAVLGVVIVTAVVGVVAAAVRSHTTDAAHPPASSVPSSAPPISAWNPPAGLVGLAAGPFVAAVDGKLILVDADGAVHQLLQGVDRDALVVGTSRDSFLVGTRPWEAMVANASSSQFGQVVPSGVTLIPDAAGRWWSNFGQLGGSGQLRHLTFADGARPVAKLRDGYLVVDAAQTAMIDQPSRGPARRIGTGDAVVLAVAGDLVAWSDDDSSRGGGTTVHVTDVATNGTADVETAGTAVTARFSPDSTRIAVLSRARGESTVLAETATGRVLKTLPTASAANAITTFRNAPPALQPSPFNWDPATGNLIVVTTNGGPGSTVAFVDVNGNVVHTEAAPIGMSQLVPQA